MVSFSSGHWQDGMLLNDWKSMMNYVKLEMRMKAHLKEHHLVLLLPDPANWYLLIPEYLIGDQIQNQRDLLVLVN